jgi:hypothetical protein
MAKMDRYEHVHGHRRVDAIAAAIVASGGEVVRASSPTVAPFELGGYSRDPHSTFELILATQQLALCPVAIAEDDDPRRTEDDVRTPIACPSSRSSVRFAVTPGRMT